MRAALIFTVFAFVFLFAGCTQTNIGKEYDFTAKSALIDWDQLQTCKAGVCEGFYCTGKLNSLFCSTNGIFKNDCPFSSLYKGKCEFKKLPTEQSFGDMLDAEKRNANSQNLQEKINRDSFRGFMLGMGSNFGDFATANGYCSNRMRFAVKWLLGGVKQDAATGQQLSVPYALPDAGRAGCFLGINIQPLYILYSEGKNIDATAAENVAKQLGGSGIGSGSSVLGAVGPAIITTEIDYDLHDANAIIAVKEQAARMKAACHDCVIALGAPKQALKMSENEKQIWSSIISDPSVQSNVDIIAFGINSKNYLGACNNVPAIFIDAGTFAGNTLYNFNNKYNPADGKPTIIAYMMFDAQHTDGNCEWSGEVLNGDNGPYAYFFNVLPNLAHRGVIGAAPYAYSSKGINPLKCVGCGVAKEEGQAKFDNYFGACQTYTSKASGSPALGILGIFATGPGGTCTNTFNPEYIFRTKFTGGDLTQQISPKYDPAKNREPVSCDSCLFNNPQPNAKFPSYIGSNEISLVFPRSVTVHIADGKTTDACHAFDSEIQSNIDNGPAGEAGFDSMLVRAVMWGESTFDPCSASPVPSSDACNSHNINNVNVERGTIITGGVAAQYSGSVQCSRVLGDDKIPSAPNGFKYCAYGIMQTNNYPSNIYERYNEQLPEILNGCLSVDGKFNPFDPQQSICLGTKKLTTFFKQAQTDFGGRLSQFRVKQITDQTTGIKSDDPDHKKVVLAYVALYYYNQGSGNAKPRIENWLSAFSTNPTEQDCRNDPSRQGCNSDGTPNERDCKGIQDFIQYVKFCQAPLPGERGSTNQPNVYDNNRRDYGFDVLVRYRSLIEKCDNSVCPAPQIAQDYAAGRVDLGLPAPETQPPTPKP